MFLKQNRDNWELFTLFQLASCKVYLVKLIRQISQKKLTFSQDNTASYLIKDALELQTQAYRWWYNCMISIDKFAEMEKKSSLAENIWKPWTVGERNL